MAEKLKSISNRIHWSSLLKAAVFALAWAFFPFWLFIIVALYLYFVPFSEARKVAGPFFVLLILCGLEPSGFWFALIFGTVFFYILLIKDLILIDRKSAYEILVFLLSFIMFRDFYIRFGENPGGITFFYAFFAAAIFAILFSSFIACFSEPEGEGKALRRVFGWTSLLLMWQVLVAGLFLPVDYSYQSVIAFLLMVPVVDFGSQYLFGEVSRMKMLATASTIFAVLVLILGSARWGL